MPDAPPGTDWTDHEIDLIVADYFDMLGMELRGKQLGLVGVGRIGRAVAEKAPAFGM